MTAGSQAEFSRYLISSAPALRGQTRLAIGVAALLIVALLLTAPFAGMRLPGTEALLPAYAAAIMLLELMTAALLLILYSVQPSLRVLVLALGYLLSGLLVVPWVLTFPSVFDQIALDAGLQGTAAIASLRRVGFPLFVLAYALMDRPDTGARPAVRRTILSGMAAVVGFVLLSTWLIVWHPEALPALMQDATRAAMAWRYVAMVSIGLYVAGLVLLIRRQRTVLDLWLCVVLCTLLIEVVQLSFVSAGVRMSLGWWAGRLCGLVSTSVVLVVLLSGTATLYARLARAILTERSTRETRLLAMEALSASIAHEIAQPVASMVTNADAGLRWLDKAPANTGEARAALRRIVSDGHRVGDLIKGLRTMFGTGGRARVPLELNAIIEEVVLRSAADARLAGVAIRAEREPGGLFVDGNPVQLHQVVVNLVGNAIEVTKSAGARPAVVRITCRVPEPGEVVVSVADHGPGVAPADRAHIFEPFFSTKPDGMGMGLMISRSIVEAHGGRIWMEDNSPHGAIFSFALPCSSRRPAAGAP